MRTSSKTKTGSKMAIINSLMIFAAGAFVSHVLHSSVPNLSSTPVSSNDPRNSETSSAKIVGALESATVVATPTSSDTSTSVESERSALSSYDSAVGEDFFVEIAKAIEPVTDKVTSHRYQRMYGQFLLPFYKNKPKMKFFEIGLGCDQRYGPGASSKMWKKLFPEAEIWEGEFDTDCVENVMKDGSGALDGFNVLTGDQGNVTVLDEWIKKSGGDFDVIIDDGGHQNCQIMTTFLKLWPLLRPGGLYFIEDLHAGKIHRYNLVDSPLCEKGTLVSEELVKKTVDQLIYGRDGEVKFLTCQSQACVLQKNG